MTDNVYGYLASYENEAGKKMKTVILAIYENSKGCNRLEFFKIRNLSVFNSNFKKYIKNFGLLS